MKVIIGSQKQEMKVYEMGLLANKMFPKIETIVFKGSFRLGIRNALDKSTYQKWDEVAGLPSEIRRRFFDSVIRESVPYLKKIGMDEKSIHMLSSELKKRNRKYLAE